MINGEKVSIILPIYNVEKYLDECIKSLINQSYRNIEILAMNDGSKDNSINIINRYAKKDNRITIISDKNKGQGACRNKAIKIASGKYLFFMDSDDYLDINTIEILIKKIMELDSDIIIYNGIAFDDYDNNIKFHKNKYFNINNNISNKIYSGREFAKFGLNYISPCIKLYNKNFIKENNIFFTEGKYGEDVEFWYKCCLYANKISYVDFIGYYRRYRANSTMTGENIRVIKDRIENLINLKAIVNMVDEEYRIYFEENLSSYALDLFYKIVKRNKKEIVELLKIFKDNKGEEIIDLQRLKITSVVKRFILNQYIKYIVNEN